jgi:glycosyltransferase involved in cell wall biosynthesis
VKLAHFTATFPPYYAGTGNVCFHQARCLAARGHDVTVFTATYPGRPVDPPGVTVRRLRPPFRIGNAPLIPRLVAPGRFDLIHLHQPFIFGSELATLRSLAGRTPLVSTVHNDLVADGPKGLLFRAYEATAARAAIARSARLAVVTLEHAQASPLLRQTLARDPERFVEVPNGVDTESFSPGDAGPARTALGIPRSATVALFCGSLDAAHVTKRLDLLLAALAAASHDQLLLLVVGGGPLARRYKAQAREFGVGDRVVFAGARPLRELPALYRAADFLAMPSELESFGIVAIEALASGVPVLARALPSMKRLVADGIDGLLVDGGDTASFAAGLDHIAGLDAEERRRMGSAGREKVAATYTWERAAELLEGAYSAAIAATDR